MSISCVIRSRSRRRTRPLSSSSERRAAGSKHPSRWMSWPSRKPGDRKPRAASSSKCRTVRPMHALRLMPCARCVSIFNAAGVPARSVAVRPYRPASPSQLATIRLNYPKMTANAGPCGLWPEDLGPTWKNPICTTNRPYWNHGCADSAQSCRHGRQSGGPRSAPA